MKKTNAEFSLEQKSKITQLKTLSHGGKTALVDLLIYFLFVPGLKDVGQQIGSKLRIKRQEKFLTRREKEKEKSFTRRERERET